MELTKSQPLAPSYSSAVDTIDERGWSDILGQFEDANIYQTWPYAEVLNGRRNMSHLIVKQDGKVVSVAQARIVKVPGLNVGVAYVRWGPLWRRIDSTPQVEDLRQALRALRNEYVHKRGLVLKIFPALFGDDSFPLASAVLQEEGFAFSEDEGRGRTILMDLNPDLEQLREGMRLHWRKELKIAERNGLELIQGTEDRLFESFIAIYKEMVSRKKFTEPNDISQFREIQSRLPVPFKMKIMLCRSGKDVCAGLISSAIGGKAVYLFGATSDAGMRSRGSYLLQWKLIACLKQEGISTYDLNGINPDKNPGTFKFKNDLAGSNGKDVRFLGRFESHEFGTSYLLVRFAEAFRMGFRELRNRAKLLRRRRLRWNEAS